MNLLKGCHLSLIWRGHKSTEKKDSQFQCKEKVLTLLWQFNLGILLSVKYEYKVLLFMIACFISPLLNKQINTSTEIQTFDILHWASRTKKTLKVIFLVGSKSKPWGRKYMISSIPSFGKSYFNLILGSHGIIIMLKLVEQKSYMAIDPAK